MNSDSLNPKNPGIPGECGEGLHSIRDLDVQAGVGRVFNRGETADDRRERAFGIDVAHEFFTDAPGQKAHTAGVPALRAGQQHLDGVEVALLRLDVIEDHRAAGGSQLFESLLAGGAVRVALAHP